MDIIVNMKIHHRHYEEIGSTQDQIIDDLKHGLETQLVSATVQNSGYGRKGHNWDQYKNSISFSFKLDVEKLSQKSIIPLSIGVSLCKFLNDFYDVSLKVKWPNDLINSHGHKVGGIICKLIDNTAIIGVGLNIGQSKEETNYKTQKGHIKDISLNSTDYSDIPLKIYSYVINKNLENEFLEFKNYCFHLNKDVLLLDDGNKYQGKFIGVGEYGEALIQINSEVKKFYSGSLYLDI